MVIEAFFGGLSIYKVLRCALDVIVKMKWLTTYASC